MSIVQCVNIVECIDEVNSFRFQCVYTDYGVNAFSKSNYQFAPNQHLNWTGLLASKAPYSRLVPECPTPTMWCPMFPKPAPETNQGGVQVSYVSINVLRDQRSVDCVLSEVKLCIDVVQKTATALFLLFRGKDQYGSDIKLLGP